MSSRLAGFVELVRAPAALTVPGDAVAGSAAAGRPLAGRQLALPAASIALYWAGMALNDFADRRLDATERPERPIPSGRVRPGAALAVAAGLTGLGLALAGAGGGRGALRVAAPLAAAVWAYDLRLKSGPAGPLAMAACRGLDVLLGASAAGVAGTSRRAGLRAALTVAAHTAGVTVLARGEVHGGSAGQARLAAGITALAASVAALGGGATAAGGRTHSRWSRARSRGGRTLGVLAASAYAVPVGRAQLAAARNPSAVAVRRATVAGIHGMVPLQAALAARAGAPWHAAAVLAALPAARVLARVVSPT